RRRRSRCLGDGPARKPATSGRGPAPWAWSRRASARRGPALLLAAAAGHDTGVKVYNSLTRRKDPLIVGSADAASWYSCGPTVYDHAHLGHACSYVRFDIIRRILTRVFGCNIIVVMGITDVDDKIIRRAAEVSAEGDAPGDRPPSCSTGVCCISVPPWLTSTRGSAGAL
uniref:tRNA synthetases class I catalytic domain-containing protein n=1 Tax=Ursus americanus TaxID=9643 RepID=A0A452SUW1_URSAM